MPARRTEKKPWPMKWVIVAILLCIIPYTWITLRYRKAGPAYQPYEDSKNRANVIRLLDAGYQRFTVPAQRNADPTRFQLASEAATIAATPGGLPLALSHTLVEIPLMPETILTVTAPNRVRPEAAYAFQFTCSVPDQKEQLAGAELYLREQTVVLIPTFERIQGDLLSRSRESLVQIEVPAGTFKPGRYEFVLIGSRQSKTWKVTIE